MGANMQPMINESWNANLIYEFNMTANFANQRAASKLVLT